MKAACYERASDARRDIACWRTSRPNRKGGASPTGTTGINVRELAALRERGGSPYACAAAIGVDHKQLDRWIKRKAPWTCWIPIKLLGALDAYLDDLPKVEKPQSTRDVSQKPRDVRAAAACSVELARAEERPFRRDEEFGEAFLHVVGNQPPIEPGTPAAIDCKGILLCKPIGSKRWIGIANAQIRVDTADEAGQTPFEGDEQTWNEAGATFQRIGGGRYMAVNIRSARRSPAHFECAEPRRRS